MRGERRVVVWVPDWPLAAHSDDLTARGPAVSVRQGRVVAASLAARRAGISPGMRLSTAEQVVPQVRVVPHDENQQAGAFEEVLAVFDEHFAGVCTAYPGLAWAPLSSSQWALPEEQILQDLSDHLVETLGVEAFVGAGSGMVASVAAARAGRIVPDLETTEFLAPLPVRSLLWGFAPAERAEYRDAYQFFTSLGVTSLSQLWAIGRPQLAGRLGMVGERLWTLSRGGDIHQMSTPSPSPVPVERWEFEEPAAVLDHVILEIRTLAGRFVDTLISRGLVAPAMSVGIEDTSGNIVERRWALTGALTSMNVSTRVVWQLRAWQDRNQTQPETDSDSEGRRLKAVTLSAPGASTAAVSGQLWGERAESGQVERAVIEVQLLAGEESVVQPHLQGGLDPRERVAFLPWGHPTGELQPTDGDWEGSLREAPIIIFDDPPGVRLFGDLPDGTTGTLWPTRRGLLTGTPTTFTLRDGRPGLPAGSYRIQTVVGLWLLRGKWWDKSAPGQTRALLRVSSAGLVGNVLLAWRGGGWSVEGIYAPIPAWSDLRTGGQRS